MIRIDGSYGSGGGQILRTALALSMLTGKPFVIEHIRAKRKRPGLSFQHLACVKAASMLSNATVNGAFVGSKKLCFKPNKIVNKDLEINIGTAGSVSLVLQALMPALTNLENELEIKIVGGTDVSKAPPIDYIKYVLLGLLRKLGYKARLEILKRGFFPKGNGHIIFKFEPSDLKTYDFKERGKLKKLTVISVASEELRKNKVCERQLLGFKKSFDKIKKIAQETDFKVENKVEYVKSLSLGSVVTAFVETEKSLIGSNSLGKPGKKAELVGEETALGLVKELENDAVVDRYASDQLLPFLALTKSSLKTSYITEHAKTNAYIIEKFLPVKFKIDENKKTIEAKHL